MIGWPFPSRRERTRREAARWIARLHAPAGEDDQRAFERWYRADPEHAAAFDRLSALFEMAGRVRTAAPAPLREERRARPPVQYALAAAVAGACLLATGVLVSRELTAPSERASQRAVFVAREGSRAVRLADGSEVVLAPGSELGVRFDATVRRLRLEHGAARFKVSHEPRPFVVAAAGTRVLARGTEFVVSLGAAGTLVSLIEGRVEVTYPQRVAGHPPRVATLAPGQRLLVPAEPAGRPSAAPGHAAPTTMIEFDDVDLAKAIERVARPGAPPIRLADPALGRLRVTGAFAAGDTAGFARGVAAALGLRLERAADGTLWLHPAGAAAHAG